jgi:ABC-2 type transport system permease protein
MMLRSVGLKALYDQRRALVAWSLSFAALVAMYAAIWPSLRDQPSMSDFLNQMPKAMRSLFAASGADMSTPVGYVQVELLAFMGPLLLIIYTVTTGAGAVAGEEARHTLDLLLANPVSRTRIVLEKLGAMTAGAVLIGAVTGVALVGEGALAGMTLPIDGVAAAMAHMTLLALVFGTMALAVGAATGRPALSLAVPVVVAVIAYVVNGLASVVSWLEPAQKFSPFYQYSGHDPLRNGLSWPAILVAAATIVVLAAIAVAAFRRRDVAA